MGQEVQEIYPPQPPSIYRYRTQQIEFLSFISGRWVAKLGRLVAQQGDGWLSSERWMAKQGDGWLSSGRWVAKQGDGWLNERWVAKSGRWEAKQGYGWLSQGDGRLSREMGGYVGSAPACYDSSLGSNPDISQIYKMGEISKGVANILYSLLKKYT